MWEHAIAWWRDWLVGAYLLGVVLFSVFQTIAAGRWTMLFPAGIAAVFLAASAFNRIRRRREEYRLMHFIRCVPEMHPQEFFDHLACCSGIFTHRLESAPYRRVDPEHLDFRISVRSRPLFAATVRGVWNTIQLSRIVLAAYRWRGVAYAQEVGRQVVWWMRAARGSCG